MSDDKLREALRKIADLAREASSCDGGHSPDDGRGFEGDIPGCVIKAVPDRLLQRAARNAISINPANAPQMAPIARSAMGVIAPNRIAVMVSKYWGNRPRRLTVSFVNSARSASAALRRKILSHLNAWSTSGCISFVETSGTGQVRIDFGPTGHWSYLGTDILSIPTNRPTMNLQAFDRENRESEFYRVVRHEAGHTLGFPHEHARQEIVARIEPNRAYAWFWQNYRWDRQTVDEQVLTPLSSNSIFGTGPDQTSIMCYQLPAQITRDGRPIIGGTDINATDHAFNGRIHPRAGGQIPEPGSFSDSYEASPAAMAAPTVDQEDWSESEDSLTLPLE